MTQRTTMTNQELLAELQDLRRQVQELEKDMAVQAESEKTYRSAIENIPDIYYRTDAEGVIILASPSAADFFGFDCVDELIGRKVEDFYHSPEDRQAFLAKLAEKGVVRDEEVTLKLRDGSPVRVATTSTLQRDESGRVLGVEGVARDIRVREQAEDPGQGNKSLLELALDASGTGVWDWDLTDGGMSFCPRCSAMLGYAPDELNALGDAWDSLLHPDDFARVKALAGAHTGQGRPLEIEVRMRTKAGQWRWVLARGKAVAWEDGGEPQRMAGVLEDIHDKRVGRERMEARFEELQALGSLSTGVALSTSMDDVVNAVLDNVVEFLAPDLAVLFIGREESMELAGARTTLPTLDNDTFHQRKLGDCLCSMAAQSTSPMFSLNVRHDPRCEAGECKLSGISSVACLPMLSRGKVIGGLGLGSERERDFSAREPYLQSLAAVASTGVVNALLHQDALRHAKSLEAEVAARTEALTKFRNAVEHSSASIVITDPQGCIEYVNPYFTKLTGYTLDEALGQNPRILKSGDHDPAFYRDMWSTILAKETWRGEIRNRRKDGALYWEDATISPLVDPDGKITNFVAVKEDITARKEQEAFLRTLLDAIPIPVFSKDRLGRYLDVNRAFEDFFGVTRGEMAGKTVFDMHPRNFAQVYYAKDEELFQRGGMQQYESKARAAKGRVCHMIFNKAVFSNAQGEVAGLIGTVLDITERKAMEDALMESTERFTNLADKLKDRMIFYSHGLDGKLLDISGGVRLLGYDFPEQVLGKHWRDIAQWSEVCAAKAENVLAGLGEGKDEPVPLDMACLDNAGNHRELLLYPFAVKDASGAPVRIEGVAIDVTEQKDREREMRLLTRAMDNATVSVVITDAHAAITYVNPQFTRSTGYTREEALGNNPNVLRSGMHEDEFYADMWRTISQGETWQGEIINKRKDESTFWEWATISPVRDETGAIAHFVAVKEDITARKELERLKEDVDRIMRHDLKTPLNAVIGLPTLLVEDENLTKDQLEMVRIIEDSGRKMLGMIDLSLDMFHMETGNYIYRPAQVDALAVLRQLGEENRARLQGKDLGLRLRFQDREAAPEDSFWVWAEERLLYPLLGNVMTNAIEASPPGGRITVSFEEQVRSPDSGVQNITVANQGAVPQVIRKHFFQKYKTHGKSEGTGLGTYSAKLLADAMNYVMSMETSDNEDMTWISLCLPKDLKTPV
ncbi:MAG: PAS domain S-box protein [Desulfovibrio sp.]|nr:MAG: PAS domain S-box protein [Desulfovibrio sp.]